MSWLVLGGTGQLGSTFRDYLKANHVNFSSPSSKVLNLLSQASINEYIQHTQPSVVVNCAAWTNVDTAEDNEKLAFDLNALAPGNLAGASKKIGAKFIHISSDYVFSGNRRVPWEETDLVNPTSVYGSSKAWGEKLVAEIYPENSFVVRTAWLYSKYGHNFAKTICRLATTNNETIDVVDDQIGQPTFTGDLVRQILFFTKVKLDPGVYHGTNSGQTSWYGFASKIFELLDKDTSRLKRISSLEYPSLVPRPAYSVLGHDAWFNFDVPDFRHWEIPLTESIAEIASEVKKK
jgi:dTDP-4-dehydrorhamnose reductase